MTTEKTEVEKTVEEAVQAAKDMPKNRRQRRIAMGINKKGVRNFSNKKGAQIIVTKVGNGREVKHKRILQRLPGKTLVHYVAA